MMDWLALLHFNKEVTVKVSQTMYPDRSDRMYRVMRGDKLRKEKSFLAAVKACIQMHSLGHEDVGDEWLQGLRKCKMGGKLVYDDHQYDNVDDVIAAMRAKAGDPYAYNDNVDNDEDECEEDEDDEDEDEDVEGDNSEEGDGNNAEEASEEEGSMEVVVNEDSVPPTLYRNVTPLVNHPADGGQGGLRAAKRPRTTDGQGPLHQAQGLVELSECAEQLRGNKLLHKEHLLKRYTNALRKDAAVNKADAEKAEFERQTAMLENSRNKAHERIRDLEGALQADKQRIRDLEGAQQADKQRIMKLECTSQQQIVELESVMEAEKQRIRDLEGRLKAANQQLISENQAFKNELNAAKGDKQRIRDLEQQIRDLEDALEADKQRIRDLEQQIKDIEGALEADKQWIRDLEGALEADKQRIRDLEGALQADKQQIMELEGALEADKQRIRDLEGALQADKQRITELEGADNYQPMIAQLTDMLHDYFQRVMQEHAIKLQTAQARAQSAEAQFQVLQRELGKVSKVLQMVLQREHRELGKVSEQLDAMCSPAVATDAAAVATDTAAMD
jgi:predicted  nucleic acid-binding Zn-ribbon protein